MKITALSDLHGYLPDDIQKCDVVCICGDISPLRIQNYTKDIKYWLNESFIPWANALPCDKVVFIAGNHDRVIERHPEFMDTLNKENDKIKYLKDNAIEINGKIFYGTPWCPTLYNWAFYGTSAELTESFSHIYKNVDVLITHCPPRINTLGTVLQTNRYNTGENYGCAELADAIYEKKPKIVFSGHIHSGEHSEVESYGTKLYNVSILNEDYQISYKPLTIEI